MPQANCHLLDTMISSLRRPLFLFPILILLCVVLGSFGWIGYNSFKTHRYLTLGDRAIESDSWQMASYWYTQILKRDSENLEAVKRMSKYASFYGDPLEVYWWMKLTKMQPQSSGAQLGLAEAFLKNGKFEEAYSVLQKTVPNTAEKPKYNNLITAYYIANHNYDQAEQYSRKSLQLDPDSNDLKLNLLNILLRKGRSEDVDEINGLMSEITLDESMLPAIWRVLSSYAIYQKDWDQAIKVSAKLVAHPDAQWHEKAGYLRLLIAFQPNEVEAYLKSIKLDGKQMQLLEGIANSLTRAGMAESALTWLDSISSADIKESFSFQVSYADALAMLTRWNDLEEKLIEEDWGKLDYYRHALLSRAHMQLNEQVESKRHWTEAVELSRDNLSEQNRLVSIIETWDGFENRWITMLSEMLTQSVHAKKAYQRLHDHFYKQRKTWDLYNISVKANRSLPDDDTIKNNLIMYSLLLKRDVESQLVEAKLLFEKYPGKPIPATTCAFALFRNGSAEEAFEMISAMDERHLSVPEIAFYAAVIARSADRIEFAEKYEKLALNAVLLPEEIELFDQKARQ